MGHPPNKILRDNIESKLGRRLSKGEFELFSNLLERAFLPKKHQLVQTGSRCKYLYFIEKGLLHSYTTDSAGQSHTIQFGFEGHWISDLYGFLSQKPAIFNIEALEDTSVLNLSKDNFEFALSTIPSFERFFRILIQNAYVNSQQRIAENYTADAEQRYRTLIKQQPDLLQRVPQYLIASYLGIKPQSLSRIRQKLKNR
jgi:hypothetical protein